MRTIDMALTALALRASQTRPPERERALVPAVDDADQGVLHRNALPHEQAALIASLWPPARQCLVGVVYAALPAPAAFGRTVRVRWTLPVPAADARVLQLRLNAAFPRAESKVQVAPAADAA